MTGEAKPFLKWPGGKSSSMAKIRDALPTSWARLIEPMVGGGAVFWALGDRRSVIADVNHDLVCCYMAVRDDVDDLVAMLKRHAERFAESGEDYYYAVRAHGDGMSVTERAARFIFLNRTSFNGMVRYNRKGQFNVPIGRYANPRICNEGLLRLCHERLQGVTILEQDVLVTIELARDGDLVYIDPPYVPMSKTANFETYNPGGFGSQGHADLLNQLRDCKNRGVRFLLSSSDAWGLRDRYLAEQWTVRTVQVARSVNSKGSGRGKVPELLVSNF